MRKSILRSPLPALLVFLILLQSEVAKAGGTWAPLATAPPTGVNHAMVLSDGTIYTDNGSGNCCRLTPDIHGNYRTGTWTRFASMNYDRLFFASQLLTNGMIFVAGGEYGGGRRHAELFDPLRNAWTKIPDPIPGPAFSDAISEMLPNGNVLVAPVSQFGGCLIYNVAANTWQTAASTINQNEVCWVKLANDNIITIDTGALSTEHYVPSLNQWRPDGNTPVPLYGYGAEIGAGFLLPNGSVFYIGGSTNTAIYTPGATLAGAGTWTAGPAMVFDTNLLGAVDAPAAMMVNGKILCDLGPIGGFNGPCSFFEYDYLSNTFTQVTAPGGGTTYNSAPFANSMLCLPDGTVLFVGGQNSTTLYIYTPDGTPLAAGMPVINSISQNADGSFHLTGTGLNGISAGAAYGDDEQMNSNYPLVRMTNTITGNVYYARTFNWNCTSVQTGSRVVATEFTLPQSLPAGTYSLVAVANGNPSLPTNFVYSPPSVPTGLTAASGSNGFVRLNWNVTAGATAYNVKRSSTLAGYFATIATVTGNSYTNISLTNGLTYFYKVAAVGIGGPSTDSTQVAATPAGPTLIPGATSVNLASFYNRAGIYSDGRTFSGGLDGSGSAFSENLLGSSLYWNGLVFGLGPSNTLDVIFCAGQTIPLPGGQFNTLQLLATAVNGSQQGQVFTVTYTDNSTTTFTQSFSDWANQQAYSGESTILAMPYRNSGGGGSQATRVSLNGYVFALDQTKTVKNIILPINSNLILLSLALANNAATVDLSTYYNRAGIYKDGVTFTNPATGGLDGGGYAYSGTVLGGSQTWSNNLFTFGPINATNVISGVNQTISLPPGNYSRLQMLGTAVNGNQPSQSFLVTYTDASTTTFIQGMSDWFSPQNYSGESKAIPMGYRNNANGSSSENNALYLYGYSFVLNPTKTIQSIRLPNNANTDIAAISLIPNWQPVFNLNPFALANATAGQPYSGAIATNASDLNKDTLTFAKVSGPAWLTVASNGGVFGTPLSPDAGDNTFLVSVTDPGGLSSTATMNIFVNGSAPITLVSSLNPDGLILSWSGGIPPYQVQSTTNLLTPDWQNVGSPLNTNSWVDAPTNDQVFYRILGQ